MPRATEAQDLRRFLLVRLSVRYLLNLVKKMFLWGYARNTWQWDILCVLILMFIFLTPKSWFESGERRLGQVHQSPTSATLLVGTETIGNEGDKSKLQERVRAVSGRHDAEVVAVRKVIDKNGKTLGYEVDIR